MGAYYSRKASTGKGGKKGRRGPTYLSLSNLGTSGSRLDRRLFPVLGFLPTVPGHGIGNLACLETWGVKLKSILPNLAAQKGSSSIYIYYQVKTDIL